MFGSKYYRYPELLTQSLEAMNDRYIKAKVSPNMLKLMQSFYVLLFGIPEIGFQVRGMYFRTFLKELKGFHPQKIGDIGCGIGCYVLDLAAKYPHALVSGFDIDREKLASAKAVVHRYRITNVTFSRMDIVTCNPIKRGKYDLLVTIDVLEHLQDFRRAITHMWHMLSPGGYLYIHVPQAKQRRFFSGFEDWEHKDHARKGFEPSAFMRELKATGFSILKWSNTFGFFGSIAWEIHHLILSRSRLLAAFFYPLLYLMARCDTFINNRYGLGVAILARKVA